MDGKGISKKGKKKYATANGVEERIHVLLIFFFLTSDALCTIVYADGVYIAGVCYHCSYELSG